MVPALVFSALIAGSAVARAEDPPKMSADEMRQKVDAVNSLLSNNATSAEGQAILAAAAVLQGPGSIDKLNDAYKGASHASPEVQAILAAAAVFSGQGIDKVNEAYGMLTSGGYKARAIQAATIVMSGESAVSVGWWYNSATGNENAKAILASAAAFSGKPVDDMNAFYHVLEGPSERAVLAAASAFTGRRITGNILDADSMAAVQDLYTQTSASTEHARVIVASAAVLSHRPIGDLNDLYLLCDTIGAGRTAQAKATVAAAAALSGRPISSLADKKLKGAQFLAIVGS